MISVYILCGSTRRRIEESEREKERSFAYKHFFERLRRAYQQKKNNSSTAMSAKVYVASRRELDEAILDGLKEALPFVAEGLEPPERPPKEVLSNREASEFLDVSKSTLQRWRNNGTLPYSKVGGNIYYKRADILRMLEEHASGTASGASSDSSSG